MTPEQALGMLEGHITDFNMEFPTTKRVLAAVPADKGDYRPDPAARPAMELAWHLAYTDKWFLDSLVAGEFLKEEPEIPAAIKTPADVLTWYAAEIPPALEKLKGISGEQASKVLDFYGAFQMPAVMYMNFLLKHSIHHRGQLSVYLRPMGGKVPSIYGGSADEPWKP